MTEHSETQVHAQEKSDAEAEAEAEAKSIQENHPDNCQDTVNLEHIENLVQRTVKHIYCAEEAFTGESFSAFIDAFSLYAKHNKLEQNNFVNNTITIMAKAHETRDMLFLADILQYELLPFLKQHTSSEISNE